MVFCQTERSYAAPKMKATGTDAQGYDKVIDPKLKDGSVLIDTDTVPPKEPNMIETKFLVQPPPRGLLERINRLIDGVDRDIPPEYDQYGYEIRRYMSRIGNLKVYTDQDYLVEQIKNVRKARIILRYWQESIEKEVKEIEVEIEANDSASTFWTVFKQNKAITRSFMIDAQGWIDSNERLLLNIWDTQGFVQVDYPEIIFIRPGERIDFFNLLQTRQFKLREIKKYQSFAMMVY